jgi:nucleotide-binding universal stress UspA family protein
MTTRKVQQILCAIRGGAQSQHTASRAVELALQAGARLTFCHVVDPGCFDCGDLARTSAAYREYVGKAESNLHTLELMARQRGVADVDLVLREGDTRQELRQVAVETGASLMVLGRPRPDLGGNRFEMEEFHQFLAELDFGGDLRTIQVRPLPEEGV